MQSYHSGVRNKLKQTRRRADIAKASRRDVNAE
jgi:hypothetical protein